MLKEMLNFISKLLKGQNGSFFQFQKIFVDVFENGPKIFN